MSLRETIGSLEPVTVGGAIECGCDGKRATLTTSAGELVVESWSDDIARLRLGAGSGFDYGLVGEPQTNAGVGLARGHPASVRAGGMTFEFGGGDGPLSVAVSCESGGKMRRLLSPPTDAHFVRPYRIPPLMTGNSLAALAFDLGDADRLHGTGEQWSSLDLRGQVVLNYNEDSLGGNASASYKNVPFVWSSAGWGLFFSTPAPVLHSLGCSHIAHRSYVAVVEGALDVFVLRGDDPAAIIRSYHELTGTPGTLPGWAFGTWLSRAHYRTEQELLDSVKAMRGSKMPFEVVVFDGRTWLDTQTRFSFEWDRSRYPDPDATLARLRKLGLKTCAWVYPMVSVGNARFGELSAKGLFLKDQLGKDYIYRFSTEPFGKDLSQLPPSGIVDFTNDNARRWWMKGCEKLLEQGFDAIKTDFGEQVPDDAVAANGDSGRRLHNVYSLLYNRATSAAFDGAGKPPVLWARSAWSGSQAHPGHWCGDSQSDWGGLRTAIRGCLQWSLSGGPLAGSDIGGFYGGPPSEELYLRWLQFGVLSGLARLHGIGPREPGIHGRRALRIARKWLGLRRALVPYLERSAGQAATPGMPVMRPMALSFPKSCPEGRTVDLQYMLGDDLLCVPVARPGGETRFWLPPGKWVDYFRGTGASGDRWMGRKCKIGEVPLFVRSGSTVELGSHDKGAIGQVSRLLLAGVPRIGEHQSGAVVRVEDGNVVMRLPEDWVLECMKCGATPSVGKLDYKVRALR